MTHALVKGFALNHTSSQVVNYDSIKEIVTQEPDKKLEVEQLKFSRDKLNWNITTDVVNKLYGMTYDKRVLIDNFETVPYGF